MSTDDGAGTREVARRLFAAEYDDATLSYSESDEERAPNYVVTPTGARVNRLFVVGVLTETESVNEDMLRARIVDPTGAFVAYAGQYQPDALAFFERSTPPTFVALTGKARTFQPEDAEQVFTSVRPETVNEVDARTRDRWTVSAAEATLRRLSLFDTALSSGLRGDDLEAHLRDHDVEAALAAGIPRAIDHYGTTTAYLEAVRELALDALAVVADEREEVRNLSLAPEDGDAAALGEIPSDLRADEAIATPELDEPLSTSTDTADSVSASTESVDSSTETGTEAEVETETETEDSAVREDTSADEADDLGSFDDTLTADAEPDTGDVGASETAATDETDVDVPETDVNISEDDADVSEDALDVSEDDLYEFDEEEREAVREEHGLSFESGTDVDSPGEAGIETPDPEDERDQATESPATGTADETLESATEPNDATESDDLNQPDEATDTDEATEQDDVADASTEADAAAGSSGEFDGDLTDAVVDVMAEIDEGDGADREAVVAAVVQRHDVDPGDAEDAIQEALMDGKCYEPGEGRLKAI